MAQNNELESNQISEGELINDENAAVDNPVNVFEDPNGRFLVSRSFDDLKKMAGNKKSFWSANSNEIYFFLIYFVFSFVTIFSLQAKGKIDCWKSKFLLSLITYIVFHLITSRTNYKTAPIYMINFASTGILTRIPFSAYVISIIYSIDISLSNFMHIFIILIVILSAYCIETYHIKTIQFVFSVPAAIIILILFFFESKNYYLTCVIPILIVSCVHFFMIPEFSFCKGVGDFMVNLLFIAAVLILSFGFPYFVSEEGTVFQVGIQTQLHISFSISKWIVDKHLTTIVLIILISCVIPRRRSCFFERNLILGLVASVILPRKNNLDANIESILEFQEDWVIDEIKTILYTMAAYSFSFIPNPFTLLVKREEYCE